MKILIIQQKKIGDVLMSTILLKALRKKFPKAKLHYLVNSHTLPVLENNPFIDEIVDYSSEIQQSKRMFYQFLKKLETKKYDVVIDVYGKISSNLMTWFSKAPIRISYHKYYTSYLYTATIKRHSEPIHGRSLAVENRLKLLEPLEIPFQNLEPKLYLTEEEIDTAKTLLLNSSISMKKPIIMVGVVGSMDSKTYPLDYMAKLLDKCVQEFPDIQLLFNFMPHQKEEAEKVYDLTKPITRQSIFLELSAPGLRDFMALCAHCEALIGNEGGANNMAQVLEVPTFTIFSPRIEKQAWFGQNLSEKHKAVHVSDLIKIDSSISKKQTDDYYRKMVPDKIESKLIRFLKQVLKESNPNSGS